MYELLHVRLIIKLVVVVEVQPRWCAAGIHCVYYIHECHMCASDSLHDCTYVKVVHSTMAIVAVGIADCRVRLPMRDTRIPHTHP
jgi:hypothetical protein